MQIQTKTDGHTTGTKGLAAQAHSIIEGASGQFNARIVGLGGGRHEFHHGSTPYGTVMSIPYWGSRVELMEVVAMAHAGRIHAETTEFPLTDAVDVYARLKAGQITGRAVLIPA